MLEEETLKKALRYFDKTIEDCTMCARNCHVNRLLQKGFCGQSIKAKISNALLHFGEEPPLVGEGGAGAVFFSGCGMRCVYCQNFAFSHLNHGKEVNDDELAEIFISLQKAGAKTLDLVTPEPHLRAIISALLMALKKGFSLPIVFNTSSYVNTETLKNLEGIVDIYLADIRYTNDEFSSKYSAAPNYWEITKKALREMYRQVGSFKAEKMRGLIVRHLILPNGISGTRKAMEFVVEELSASVPISLMSQYFPVYKAREISELNRKITKKEYEDALEVIEKYGLNGWYQPLYEKGKDVYAKSIGELLNSRKDAKK
jgi:putative pyruvate formate lyase activating enzyme